MSQAVEHVFHDATKMDVTLLICSFAFAFAFSFPCFFMKKVFREKPNMNAMCDTSRSALPTGGAGLRSVRLPGLRGHILEGLTHLQ